MLSLEAPNSKYQTSFLESLSQISCVDDNNIFRNYADVKLDASSEEFSAFVTSLNSLKDEYHFWVIYFGEYAGRIVLYTPNKENNSIRLSYQIEPKMRGKGIASAAMSMAKEKASELGFNHINIICDPNNLASQKVILKNGGVTIGTFDDNGSEKIRYLIDL